MRFWAFELQFTSLLQFQWVTVSDESAISVVLLSITYTINTIIFWRKYDKTLTLIRMLRIFKVLITWMLVNFGTFLKTSSGKGDFDKENLLRSRKGNFIPRVPELCRCETAFVKCAWKGGKHLAMNYLCGYDLFYSLAVHVMINVLSNCKTS